MHELKSCLPRNHTTLGKTVLQRNSWKIICINAIISDIVSAPGAYGANNHVCRAWMTKLTGGG
jgi:hypothetical protein